MQEEKQQRKPVSFYLNPPRSVMHAWLKESAALPEKRERARAQAHDEYAWRIMKYLSPADRAQAERVQRLADNYNRSTLESVNNGGPRPQYPDWRNLQGRLVPSRGVIR